ncbi:cytochrome b [Cupriavidus agavae]|uniref:Cytochrome b561 n=1 Tax=Cupriavidus agavae TaxID=1001822 RepID=A0A4Q7SB27_9BURK|nr:cytochrome b [Cupriavidus agavae]RZT42898.1 cytochrome b561 [Cupriavidus agavae]
MSSPQPSTDVRLTAPTVAPFPDYERYDALAIALHWLMFMLVAMAYATIELRDFFDKGTVARMFLMDLHKWAGALILALVVPRLLWRLVRGGPAPEPGPQWGHRLAGLMHGALYVYLIAQPLLGLVMMNAAGRLLVLPYVGIEVPAIVPPSPALNDATGDLHEALGQAFYLIIGLHAMAALFRHYMLGDNTMRRMGHRR